MHPRTVRQCRRLCRVARAKAARLPVHHVSRYGDVVPSGAPAVGVSSRGALLSGVRGSLWRGGQGQPLWALPASAVQVARSADSVTACPVGEASFRVLGCPSWSPRPRPGRRREALFLQWDPVVLEGASVYKQARVRPHQMWTLRVRGSPIDAI